MISTLDKSAIQIFLKTCKKEISKGNCHFVNRNLNIDGKIINSKQALINLGIMKQEQIWQFILELKVTDCIKVDFDNNPKMDMNSEVYIFKKKINGKIVYIKLTIRKQGIVCISFHESY